MNPEFTIASHFSGKAPVVREVYDALLAKLGELGPVVEEAKKTSIHLVNASAFAGVATRKSYLLLNIKSKQKLDSPRFHKSERLSASRYHQEVKLEQVVEVDEELMVWLRAAYELST
jgi:Domain of unknown function (DUF5655)